MCIIYKDKTGGVWLGKRGLVTSQVCLNKFNLQMILVFCFFYNRFEICKKTELLHISVFCMYNVKNKGNKQPITKGGGKLKQDRWFDDVEMEV